MAKPTTPKAPKITKKMLDAIVQPMFRSFIILAMDCPGAMAYKAATQAHQAWFIENIETFKRLDLDTFAWTEFLPATRAYVYDLQAYARGLAGPPTFDSTMPDEGVETSPITYATYRSEVWERDEEDWDDDDSEPDEPMVDVPPAAQQDVSAATAAPASATLENNMSTQPVRTAPMAARRTVATRGNVTAKVAAPEVAAEPAVEAPTEAPEVPKAAAQAVKASAPGVDMTEMFAALMAKVDALAEQVQTLQESHAAHAELSQQTSDDVEGFRKKIDEATLGVNGIYAGILFIVNSTLLEEPILDLCDLLPPDDEEPA